MPAKASKSTKAAKSADAAQSPDAAKSAKAAKPAKPAKAVPSRPAPTAERVEVATERTGGASVADQTAATEAAATEAAATEAAQTETDEFVPMNRAERRAKGRAKSLPLAPGGRGKIRGSHGPIHTQRNWANRRTG